MYACVSVCEHIMIIGQWFLFHLNSLYSTLSRRRRAREKERVRPKGLVYELIKMGKEKNGLNNKRDSVMRRKDERQ